MTKAEIIKALEPYPDNMDVFVAERKTEFAYGLVNSVYKKKINFKEDPDSDEILATGNVIIFDEE